jgi:hypothetical protein
MEEQALLYIKEWVKEWVATHGSLPEDDVIEFNFGSEPIWGDYYGGAMVSRGIGWHKDVPSGLTLVNVLDNRGYTLETGSGSHSGTGLWEFDSREDHRLLPTSSGNNPWVALYVEGKKPKVSHMELVLHKLVALGAIGARPQGNKWSKEITIGH